MAWKLMAASAALAALAFAVPASATVLYSTDFASPTFADGALAGQGGWGVFTVNGGGTPTVQDTVTDNGAPAVDLGSRAVAYYSYGPVTPTGPITVSADFDVVGAGNLAIVAISSASPFDSGDDFMDWAAGVEDDGGGLFSVSSDLPKIDASLATSTWHNLSMTLDYATQTFDVTLDGNLLASGSLFCGYAPNASPGFYSCTGAESAQFEGIELAQLGGLRNGGIYFGDVSITEVPEPGAWTMMIAGVALTGAALRTRRRLAA